MDEHKRGYLALLRFNRTQAAQILIVGLVLAVGVNLLSDYVSAEVGHGATLWAGLAALVFGSFLILGRVFRPRPRIRRFDGFVIYDGRGNELVEGDFEYELGRALTEYFKSAFAEDASLKMIWETTPISERFDRAESTGDVARSFDLLRQATEYFVLSELSTRLTDHFVDRDFDPDELETISHTDIPDVLLQNRFLRIFSEPMEDRAAFAGEQQDESDGWTVWQASAKSGALYSRFELRIPTGWKIKRKGHAEIEIDARRFTLNISTICEGWGTVLPYGYLRDYLGLGEADDPPTRFAQLATGVEIRIAPRRVWLLRTGSWRYYRWIDEWIADLEPKIDQEAYLKRIGYATAATTLKMTKAWRRRERKNATESSTAQQIPAGTDDYPRPREIPATLFNVGDVVEHATFGKGTIVSREDAETVRVQFDKDGSTRALFLPYAPLRPA